MAHGSVGMSKYMHYTCIKTCFHAHLCMLSIPPVGIFFLFIPPTNRRREPGAGVSRGA